MQVLLLKDGMKGMSGLSNDKQEASCSSAFSQMVSEAVHCFVSIGCDQGNGLPLLTMLHWRHIPTFSVTGGLCF